MVKRKRGKAKTSRLQFLIAFFTGSLDKPKTKKSKSKRKAKARIPIDASKGRKRIPKPKVTKAVTIDEP